MKLKVTVEGKEWCFVESLESSTEKDTHYTIDPTSGRLIFGDGVHGKKPKQEATIGVTYRYGSGNVSVQPSTVCGIYRALVVNNVDPMQMKRVMVEVPAFPTMIATWAASSFPPGVFAIPEIGQVVWIAFEAGNIHFPVVLGVAQNEA